MTDRRLTIMCAAAGCSDVLGLRDALGRRYGEGVHIEGHHSGAGLEEALSERLAEGELVPLLVVADSLADGPGADALVYLAGRDLGLSTCKVLIAPDSDEADRAVEATAVNGVVSPSATESQLCDQLDRFVSEFFPAGESPLPEKYPALVLSDRVVTAGAFGGRAVAGLEGSPSHRSFLDERDLSDDEVEQAMIAELELVLGYPPRKRLPAGTLVVAEGQELGAITVVLDGQVRLYREVDGREIAFHQLTAGRIIGLMSLARSRPAVFSVEAETDVTVLEVALEELDTAVLRSPSLFAHFVSVLIRSLARRNLRSIEQQLQIREFARSRIQETERLAVVGQLAAGVAHELNNPLQGIVAYSHLLLERLVEDDRHHSFVEKIVAQADRCIAIVRALLDFSRPTAPKKQSSDMNSLVGQCIDLVDAQAQFINIEFVQELDPDLPLVMVDPAQLQQVFVNLIVNAAEAMDGAGRIAITTRRFDGGVEVEVADEGPGIDPEDLDRVFDPFFSTKEAGHGTGLGLAISYGIVREHEGEISVTSRPATGATFVVRLPIMADRPWSDKQERG